MALPVSRTILTAVINPASARADSALDTSGGRRDLSPSRHSCGDSGKVVVSKKEKLEGNPIKDGGRNLWLSCISNIYCLSLIPFYEA